MEAFGEKPTLVVMLSRSQEQVRTTYWLLPSILSTAFGACSSSGRVGTDAGSQSGGVAETGGTGGATASDTGGATPVGETGGATQPSTGGATGSGGVAKVGGTTGSGTAGAMATGGNISPVGSGGVSSGGTGSTGPGSGGSGSATGGASVAGTSGRGGAGGAAAGGMRSGGAIASGGTGGPAVDGGTSTICGATPAPNPFGCGFAWGVNGGNPSSLSYLQFISNWAGYNIQKDGTFGSNGFDESGWIKSFASSTIVPAYYAYIIGYYGHINGLPDGNQSSGPNLTTGMGALLLGVDNAACPQGPPATICADNVIVKAYAWYAAQTYAAFKKPVIWLLEGDFVQYSPEGAQTVPLSYAQTGQLAAQITAAIKCNDPPAVVAINYSTWINTAQLNSYIGGINTAMTALGTSYDMIWTTGTGTSANAGNASYASLHALTGKPILVDESFGLSAAGDSWSNQSATIINARIGGGVVAANITTALPSYLQTNVTTTLAPSALNSTCP